MPRAPRRERSHHAEEVASLARDLDTEAANVSSALPWTRRLAGARSDAWDPSGARSARYGIGGQQSADPTSDISPPVAVVQLADEHIVALMSRGLPHRLMTYPVERALAPRARVERGDDRDFAASFDANVGIWPKLQEAICIARADRAAFLLVVTDEVETVADLAEPIPDDADVVQVHVVGRREATPRDWDDDLRSARYATPSSYTVTLDRDVVSLSGTVHASRMIRIDGAAHLPYQSATDEDGYGVGMMDLYWQAIRDRALASGYTAKIILQKGRVYVRFSATTKRGPGPASSNTQASIADRLRTFIRSWGGNGVGILSDGDEVGRDDIALAGVSDVLVSMWMDVASVEGQSLTSLTGQAPGGLSTDDEAGRRTAEALMDKIRASQAEPALRQLYDIQYGAGEWGALHWGPYRTPTAKEQADRAEVVVRVLDTLVTMGAISVADVAATVHPEGQDSLIPLVLADEAMLEADSSMVAAEIERIESLRAEREDALPTPTDEDRERRYTVPESAANNARQALKWRDEGKAVPNANQTRGWDRAEQLASDETVSGQDIIDIAAWWARHVDWADAPDVELKGEPWKDDGYVMGQAWGGATARTWATEAREAMGEDE